MDDLITKIEHAFAGVVHPGDARLTRSTYGEEPAALEAAFRGKTDWRRLDASFLDQAPDGWSSALSFFSDEAFHFYLPAYLIADIRGQLHSADPTSRLCSWVSPQGGSVRVAKAWGGGTMGERARAAFASYTAEQVSAIVLYLWWKLESVGGDDPTIEQALTEYWLGREKDAGS